MTCDGGRSSNVTFIAEKKKCNHISLDNMKLFVTFGTYFSFCNLDGFENVNAPFLVVHCETEMI